MKKNSKMNEFLKITKWKTLKKNQITSNKIFIISNFFKLFKNIFFIINILFRNWVPKILGSLWQITIYISHKMTMIILDYKIRNNSKIVRLAWQTQIIQKSIKKIFVYHECNTMLPTPSQLSPVGFNGVGAIQYCSIEEQNIIHKE